MQHLLLLHGAIGSASQFHHLEKALAPYYNVHLFDFPGHGGKEATAPFSISFFAAAVMEFLDTHELDHVSLFGYSMGGYVGLYLAKHHPQRIDHVITLATKFEWDEDIAARETRMLQPEVIEQKLPAFAATLAQRHTPGDWKQVLNDTAVMLGEMGKDNPLKAADYATIDTPALVMVGDSDKMVSLAETLATYKQLPAGHLAVLPSTPHPIEQVDTDMLVMLIRRFIM